MGGGGPVAAVSHAVQTVTHAVTQVVQTVAHAAENIVSVVPVVGKATAGAIAGAAGTVTAPVNTLGNIAAGDNVVKSITGGASQAVAGAISIVDTPVTVAQQYTPQAVQELPVLSTVFQTADTSRAITANEQGTSGAGEDFTLFRNVAEIGAVAATLGAATSADAGETETADVVGDLTPESESVGTVADVGETADAAEESTGILGTGVTPLEAAGGGALALQIAKAKNPLAAALGDVATVAGFGDFLPGQGGVTPAPSAGAPGGIGTQPSTLVPGVQQKNNTANGSNGSGFLAGLSPTEKTAAVGLMGFAVVYLIMKQRTA